MTAGPTTGEGPMNDEHHPDDEALRALWDAEVMDHPATRDGCPPADALLGALEGGRGGHDPEAARILEHVARCAPCRDDARLVRALLVAGGAEQATPPPRRRFFPIPLAAAASVLLVVGGAGLAWRALGPADDALRGTAPALEAPSAVCTGPGVVELRWDPVAGARDYRVELFSAEGDLVARGEAEGGARTLTLSFDPDPSSPPPRAQVEARLADGTLRASPAMILPEACTGEGS
jgi:hypothetical protein